MQYAFILGSHPKLSAAEIKAVLPQASVVDQADAFLILETDSLDCEKLLKRLGGSIKIAEVLDAPISPESIVDELKKLKISGKLKFGVSFYHCPQTSLGMQVKGELKKLGISSRSVVGRDKALSSVIVTKNKVQEFLVLANKYLAKTCAVQDFENYSHRDFGRPQRDMKSGSLPPKLAQMMINFSRTSSGAVLLDPFCGSGTVLQEALLLGYKNIIGTDKSERAIADSKKNIEWLSKKVGMSAAGVKIFQQDVASLSKQVSDVDVIVTEPYLGPPLRDLPQPEDAQRTVDELAELYQKAFEQFVEVLVPGGVVVFIFPSIKVGKRVFTPDISEEIKNLGFSQVNEEPLLYGRQGQKVFRNIKIFKLSS